MISDILQKFFIILFIFYDVIYSDNMDNNASGLTESNATTITTKPDYGITNVTTQIGTNAYLPCKVKKMYNKSVSWVRVRDDHILTVDRITFIADERFHPFYASNDGQQQGPWTLQIKYVQPRDAGIYECQVSSEPKVSARVYLQVVVPKTELQNTSRYVKEGSKVNLQCTVSGALDPPLYIIWYQGNQQIFPDNKRMWKTYINRNYTENGDNHSTMGSLMIPSINRRDSGNYTCSPSNSGSASIFLHVTNAEYSASAITSSSNREIIFSRLLSTFSVILMIIQT